MPHIDQWREMWKDLGAPVCNDALCAEVIAHYTESHRHYHTTRHIEECFAHLASVWSYAVHPREIELALWFHDAIYDVKRQDNEERSAAWARASCLEAGLSLPIAERIHALVMATRHITESSDPDAQLLVDIDLAILGTPAERFDEYERQVRAEYAHMPDVQFRRERSTVLEHFLARPRIFHTEYFTAAYETQARDNLRRSVQRLRD